MSLVTRRLPGIRFETASPPLTDTLPRMDVAVFVGFAASGPLQTPVAVEEIAQFTMIFGDDVPLAWDEARGEMLHAYLAPAVKAFFRNGGRRAWIIRVADARAATNHFPVPGLAHFDGTTIRPAYAHARSEGSWSDALQTSAALTSHTLALTPTDLDALRFTLTLAAPNEVVAGDLLRLTFATLEADYTLLCRVQGVTADANAPIGLPQVIVTGEHPLWFALPTVTSPPLVANAAWHFPNFGSEATLLPFGDGLIQVQEDQGITRVTVDIAVALEDAPPPGALLRVDVGAQELWQVVQEVRAKVGDSSPLAAHVEITGEGLLRLPAPPAAAQMVAPTSEKLTFELAVRQDGGYPQRLPGLAFAPQHQRYWAALPTDAELYASADAIARSDYPALWQTVATPRFPLAGNAPDAAAETPPLYFFPLAMPPLGDQWLAADRLADDALERDGLADFDAMLFLDDALIGSSVTTLNDQADFIRYQSAQPGHFGRNLRGIHAALGLEEATLIVVPDAVHRGWIPVDTPPPPPAQPSPPFIRPEWWTFQACAFPPHFEAVAAPLWGNFLACALRVIPAPTLTISATLTDRGDYVVAWTPVNEAEIVYILEESAQPDFTEAIEIYRGHDLAYTATARGFGDYYYRVRAETVDATLYATSDWSNGVVVRVAPLRRWLVHPAADYATVQPDTLLTVQRALLRVCAARGDLFGVLALPAHYREHDAIQHTAALRSPLPTRLEMQAQASAIGGATVAPLGYGEARALTCGALYHPWLVERVQADPLTWQNVPPDGAACGILAQRALTRGAWIAPANEPLRDIIALTPAIARDHWLDLQLAQINIVRQEPRGFVIMSADTLSNDADLRPINVRRLLMLLRRMALRLGFGYVFEPNDATFRRLVQRGFEAMLEQMFVRGAFAGNTAATSYQVVTSDTLNTPQSVELGRFIVELRVAPALPMTFLTIRLLQTHDRTFVTE